MQINRYRGDLNKSGNSLIYSLHILAHKMIPKQFMPWTWDRCFSIKLSCISKFGFVKQTYHWSKQSSINRMRPFEKFTALHTIRALIGSLPHSHSLALSLTHSLIIFFSLTQTLSLTLFYSIFHSFILTLSLSLPPLSLTLAFHALSLTRPILSHSLSHCPSSYYLHSLKNMIYINKT